MPFPTFLALALYAPFLPAPAALARAGALQGADSRPASRPALLAVEWGSGGARFRGSVERLVAWRGGRRARIDPSEGAAALTALVRAQGADAVAIAIAPEDLDQNLHRRIVDALARVDADPFLDATLGYWTGNSPAELEARLDAMVKIEREGIRGPFLHAGVATADSFLWYPQFGSTGGVPWQGAFLPTLGKSRDPRASISQLYERSKGASVLSFSGNGDPMRIWLFPGERNLDRAAHWPYAPAKVVRNMADSGTPGLGGEDVDRWDLAEKVVWFSTCHSGTLGRAFVARDIVSTFGDTGRAIRAYALAPGESLGLRLLARRPACLVAPIGPNHGFASDVELSRAIGERLAVGEALRRNHADLVLAWRENGGIPLVQQAEGEPESIPEGGGRGAVMREGTLNRALFGDPLFAPFARVEGARPALAIEARFEGSDGDIAVRVLDPKSPQSWDPYHGGDRGERLVGSFEIPPGFFGIRSIAVASPVALTGTDWAVDWRRGGPPQVWFSLNAKPPADLQGRALWKEGASYRLRVTLATDDSAMRPHGTMDIFPR